MTSKVTIEAMCGDDNVVKVSVGDAQDAQIRGDVLFLEDGESDYIYFFDERVICTTEINKLNKEYLDSKTGEI